MKYSQIKIGLLTFALGLASVGFFNMLSEKWNASYVALPKVNSHTPIVIKVCLRHKPSKPSTDINESGGGGCGGARDIMCDSIPVAFSESRR
jgi:hypothetical protein